MHRPIRFEHVVQSCEPCIGIGEMMENSCADNLIEAHPQSFTLLDGKLVDLKILQVVFAFELFRAPHARSAEVDASDLSFGPTQSMLCCLRRPAAGDENGMVFPVWSVRPEEMMIRAASERVFPEPTILFKAIDRPRIGITVVEALDLVCDIK